MKGVSEIISIILIVMIVVSLAGVTWTWYNGIVGTVTEANTNATSTATSALGTQMRIEAARYDAARRYVNVTIRNIGTVDIDLSKLGNYVDGSYCTTYTPNAGRVTPGETRTIGITNRTPACNNKIVKITLESGFEDYRTISCP